MDYIQHDRLSGALVNRRAMFEDTIHGTWLDLICATQLRYCTDPRDQIYGTLAISPASLVTDIMPLYSLTISEVYKQATLTYIDRSGRIDILEHANFASRAMQGPSWVPDWEKSIGGEIACCSFASGLSCASTNLISDDGLEVTGVHVCTFLEASSPLLYRSDILSCMREWKPKGLLSERNLTEDSLMTAFAMTIECGIINDRCPGLGGSDLQEWKDLLLSLWNKRVKKEVSGRRITDIKILKRMTFTNTTHAFFGISAEATRLGE